MKKKILMILIFILLLGGLLNFKVSALSETQIKALSSDEQFELFTANIDNTNEYYFYHSNLSAIQQSLYRKLVDHFKESLDNYDQPITWTTQISANLTDEDVEQAITAFLYDYNVFFWLTGHVPYDITKYPALNKAEYVFQFTTLEIYQNELTFKQDLQEIVIKQEMIKNAVKDMKNTYSKVKYIHDWLLDNNEYRKSGEESHTPVGALVDRFDPVCEAYAEAFSLLTNYVGIRTVYATGTESNSLGTEKHAWNYVFLGDRYYFLDITWDKPLNSPDILYDYFLTTMPSSHIPDAYSIKPTPFTNYNYPSNQLVEFNVSSVHTYKQSQSGVKGYESITIIDHPEHAVNVTYFDQSGNQLNQAPKEVGKYYFIVTPKSPTSLIGDLRVDFEIVEVMHTVEFKDFDTGTLIASVEVKSGGNAELPVSSVDGYKLTAVDTNYLNVTKNEVVLMKREKITVTFYNADDEIIEVDLPSVTSESIIDYNFESINTDPNKIFIGWLNNGILISEDSVLNTDLTLKPLVEEIKFNIEDSAKSGSSFKISPDHYGKEKIKLTSENQIIKSQTVTAVDENNNYQIILVIGSEYSSQEVSVTINMTQSSMYPFGLNKEKLILYGIVGVVGIIVISIIASVVRSRRED